MSRYSTKPVPLRAFIRANREGIDRRIRQAQILGRTSGYEGIKILLSPAVVITDDVRAQWVIHHPGLFCWSQNENVRVFS